MFEAAAAVPGLTPTREEVAAEAALNQGDKDGLEIDQGIFLAHVLASERAGPHLCHAMLLPRPESAELAAAARGRRRRRPRPGARRAAAARRSMLTASNPRFLNAEDDSTLDAMEIAVDVAILDPATEIAVLRGGVVEHPKYRGRQVFGAGINLTHLYRGKIPFVWFLQRDMGYVHKLLRGVARPDALPDDVHGRGIEKPWIAAVDTFAIGGHCQILLAVDYVLAARRCLHDAAGAQGGHHPGPRQPPPAALHRRPHRAPGDPVRAAAALRQPRGAADLRRDRPGRRDGCGASTAWSQASPSAGAVSAIGNRRAFRVGQEPLDLFRRYASVYAREQAYCHFSPALIANLERNWNAKERALDT